MAKIIILIFILLLSSTEQSKLLHDSIIDTETNSLKAGENVDANTAEGEHLMLSGTRRIEAVTKSKMMHKTRHTRYVVDNQIHEEFDARKRWPQCKTIGEVHNDGNTRWGSAYAAAGELADRMCIATNARYNQPLSTQELIFCSDILPPENGAVNDIPIWEYLKTHGLVSGGKYNTKDGCQPSKMPPIGNIPTYAYNSTCEERCYGNHMINYLHDRVRISNYYSIKSYEDIQKDVQTYGPVSVAFLVYDDFFFYKSGVYAKTEKSNLVKWQYAKLIGWGVENGVDYWLLVNSWGYEWGQNGLFKIKRGTNECFVEDFVYAGRPDLCKMHDPDPKLCKEDGELCDIYTSKCVNNIHYSNDSNSPFFAQHYFTLDTPWKTVGTIKHCGNVPCSAEYTRKIEKSTEVKYGNETSASSSISIDSAVGISVGGEVSGELSTILYKSMRNKLGALIGAKIDAKFEVSEQHDSQRSFEVTYTNNNFTVSYSTSTANTVGVEDKITCYGDRNQKIFIQERTNMIRLKGNFCVYLRYSETFKKHVFKCNYVELSMYPVHDKNVVIELKCNSEETYY